FVDRQQEHLLEQVEHLGLVLRNSAEEPAVGIACRLGDRMLDRGTAPDPAMGEAPLFVSVCWPVRWHASVVRPESHLIGVQGNQATSPQLRSHSRLAGPRIARDQVGEHPSMLPPTATRPVRATNQTQGTKPVTTKTDN